MSSARFEFADARAARLASDRLRQCGVPPHAVEVLPGRAGRAGLRLTIDDDAQREQLMTLVRKMGGLEAGAEPEPADSELPGA